MRLKWKKRVIDKYIFKQVIYPFLVGVFLISVIMVSNYLFQLTDLIILKNIQIIKVLRLLLYRMPEIMVQTFPMAILFSTMYSLGRLSRENEFTALRMGGISLYRLLLPLIIFGILVTGMTFYINERIVPWTNHKAQNIVRQSVLKEANPDIEENVFFEGPEGRLFYVDNYNDNNSILKNVVIFEKSNDNKYPQIITANRGEVKEQSWQLEEGITHSYDNNGNLELETDFKVMEIKIGEEMGEFFGNQKTPSEMSRQELKKEIALFKRSGIDVTSLVVEYHLKLAISFVPLIFILIGTPLSLSNNDSRALSIIFTIVIIFLYYFLLSLFRSLGKNKMIPPLIAAWMPNLIFSLVGVFLIIFRETWQNWLRKIIPSFLQS
ncbi:MAG: LptF/LptG family permease [Bacillota bacterium]